VRGDVAGGVMIPEILDTPEVRVEKVRAILTKARV
jgi:hypothetical protein